MALDDPKRQLAYALAQQFLLVAVREFMSDRVSQTNIARTLEKIPREIRPAIGDDAIVWVKSKIKRQRPVDS